VRIVVAPHDAVHAKQVTYLDADRIILEAGMAVLFEVVARLLLKFRRHPEGVFFKCFVHSGEREWHPTCPGFDGRKLDFWKALEHTRSAQLNRRLQYGIDGMDHVVNDGAAIAAGSAGILTRAGMETDRHADLI